MGRRGRRGSGGGDLMVVLVSFLLVHYLLPQDRQTLLDRINDYGDKRSVKSSSFMTIGLTFVDDITILFFDSFIFVVPYFHDCFEHPNRRLVVLFALWRKRSQFGLETARHLQSILRTSGMFSPTNSLTAAARLYENVR